MNWGAGAWQQAPVHASSLNKEAIMRGVTITMRNGKVYENMDLRGTNNAATSGINFRFMAQENPMAWIELNSNDILTIDASGPLAGQAATTLTAEEALNVAVKDVQAHDPIKDLAKGLN